MKSIYDKRGLQTNKSREFGAKVEKAVQPILKEYLDKGFSIRDLSHEAQNIVRDLELEPIMDIYMEDAKKAVENLGKKKMAKAERLMFRGSIDK